MRTVVISMLRFGAILRFSFPASSPDEVKAVRLAGDVLVYPSREEDSPLIEPCGPLQPGDFLRTLDDRQTAAE